VKIEFKTYSPNQTLAGKITMRPETFEEQQELDDFRAKVGNKQTGKKFDIVYPNKRLVGPEEIGAVLRHTQLKEEPNASG